MTWLDGNAMAGELREIFAVDLTAAVATCAGCKGSCAVAALRVWGPAPGLVARCPACDDVVLRLVRGPERAWLDLRGAVCLRVPLPAADPAAEDPAEENPVAEGSVAEGSVAEGPA